VGCGEFDTTELFDELEIHPLQIREKRKRRETLIITNLNF